MRLTTKVKRTASFKNKINQLKTKLSKLNGSKIFVGYFDDQGNHEDSGLTYVELMTIHEYGSPEDGIPARPVLNITQEYGNFSTEDRIEIANAFKGVFVKNIPLVSALEKIGNYYQQKGKDVFGSSQLLQTVRGNDPLVWTGDLRGNFSYRTSFTYGG